MLSKLYISIIVPFYNAETHIKNCLDGLKNQEFSKPFEVIMIDDGSTDNSQNLVKKYDFPGLILHSLPKNSGPGAARNVGLKKAKGEYIFLIDVDDSIDPYTLTILYNSANENNYDFVFSDFKRIENSKNLRENFFNYLTDKTFKKKDLEESMKEQVHFNNFGHLGLFGINGRLIKRSIINDNNILFEEKLRYLEDETFAWDVVSSISNAKYIRKQLYSYYVYPNTNSAVSTGLDQGFPISDFKLVQRLSKFTRNKNLKNLQQKEGESKNNKNVPPFDHCCHIQFRQCLTTSHAHVGTRRHHLSFPPSKQHFPINLLRSILFRRIMDQTLSFKTPTQISTRKTCFCSCINRCW